MQNYLDLFIRGYSLHISTHLEYRRIFFIALCHKISLEQYKLQGYVKNKVLHGTHDCDCSAYLNKKIQRDS